MTDKTIINGVDVSGCEWYKQAVTGFICTDYNKSNDCSKNNNCYYKQLKHKEETLKISRHYNDELTKYILNIAELFNLTKYSTILGKNCIEYYATLSSTIKNRIHDLQTELQAKKEKVKELEDILQDPEVRVALTDVRTGERELWYKLGSKSNKYKQALEEIEELITNYCNAYKGLECELTNCRYCNYKKILQKCEVLDEQR